MVTSPMASMPSVTDFTENSINSLGTPARSFKARQTASTGPVPTAEPVVSLPSSSETVTVAVGRKLLPQLTCTSLSWKRASGCYTCSLTIASRYGR